MSDDPEPRAGALEVAILAENPAQFGAALSDLGDASSVVAQLPVSGRLSNPQTRPRE